MKNMMYTGICCGHGQMTILLWSLALLVTMTFPAVAWLPDYAPFEPGKAPMAAVLHPCAPMPSGGDKSSSARVFTFDISPADGKIVVESRGEELSPTLRMVNANGQVLLAPQKIEGDAGLGVTLRSGRFNDDAITDYVVETWSGGNGLAAGYAFLTFLLSGEKGFSAITVTTLNPSSGDFVDLDQDSQVELIHTAFISGEKGKDGKTHNYWVYNVLRFKGRRVVSGNSLDPRFPVWIWFTEKPNHKPTVQLTGEQKMRLWRQGAADLFPMAEALASEQASQVLHK